MRPNRVRALLFTALPLAFAAPAAATPVTHTLISASSLSGTVQAELSFVMHTTTLGDQSGTAMASGALSSTPDGTIAVDWGAPSFTGDLTVPAGGVAVNNLNPGTATGSATVSLFGFIPVTFGLSVPLTNLTLGVATSATQPLSPSSPGAGPWSAAFSALDVTIGATGSFTATGPFGINITGPLNIPAASVGGVPVMGTLSRLGGDPGNGTQIDIPISGLDLMVPMGGTTNIVTPGCEVSIGLCVVDVTSVDVTLDWLEFQNVNGELIAQQTGVAIVPEPGTMGLVLLGLAGLAAAARRRAPSAGAGS
jgi:hypothetical protein